MSDPTYDASPRATGDGPAQAVLTAVVALFVSAVVVALGFVPEVFDPPYPFWLGRTLFYGPLVLAGVGAAIRCRSIARLLAVLALDALLVAGSWLWWEHLITSVLGGLGNDYSMVSLVLAVATGLQVAGVVAMWGVARRRGALWPAGALVAGAVYVLGDRLDWWVDLLPHDPTPATAYRSALTPALVVLGCLIAWGLDRAVRRDSSQGSALADRGY